MKIRKHGQWNGKLSLQSTTYKDHVPHLDGLEVVQHGVNDPHILGPGSLEEDVPGHGEHPADAGDPPHLLLQDDLGVVVGAGVVQTSPQEVPIHPDTGILELEVFKRDILLRILQGIFEGLKLKNWLIRALNQFHVT